jgi:hypothetical protein
VATLKKYVKKQVSRVVAVQIDLETEGFTYRKWGGTQIGKAGDWLVNNDGDVYTVDRDSFANTYREVSPGIYEKVGPVWAEVAQQSGQIETKEGMTDYEAGDYLVYNNEDRKDGYAVTASKFEEMYQRVDSSRD